MLEITATQMSHLGGRQRRKFEDRLFEHARTHLADRCRHLQDDQLRSAIAATIGQARKHGLASELGVCLYLNVAIWFGVDFPRDGRIPWAFPIQRQPEEPPDPVWILRVSEIASLTMKQQNKAASA